MMINMIRILFVASAAQLIVNKRVDSARANKRTEQDLGEPSNGLPTGMPIREFADIPPKDIETFNGDMGEDGMFEHVSCDKASGACYHLDNGNVQFDRTMRINDYRKLYNTDNSHKKEVGNNHINVNVLQTIEDHGEKIENIRREVEEHVTDKLTIHKLVITACILVPIVFGIVVKIILFYYKKHCRTGAAQKLAAKEVRDSIKELFEENPDHVLKLLQFLLAQYSTTFCNKYLKNQEATIAKRVHQRASDEEMRELVESTAVNMGLLNSRQSYYAPSNEGSAPHM